MIIPTPRFKRIEWKFQSYGKHVHLVRLLDVAQRIFNPARPVLDIGCGSGGLSHFLEHYVGLDIDVRALQTAAVNRSNPAEFILADCAALPFKNGSISQFISMSMLEHVPQPAAVIQEIHRVSDGVGMFVLPCADTIPFLYDPVNRIRQHFGLKPVPQGAFGYGHSSLLKLQQWEDLISQSGFKIEESLPFDDMVLGQLEFFFFSLVFRSVPHYSDLPIKTISRLQYVFFNKIHRLLSKIDVRSSMSFCRCFVVRKN